MFGIGGCEEVWSSIFWAHRHGKHKHQMKGSVVKYTQNFVEVITNRWWPGLAVTPWSQSVYW